MEWFCDKIGTSVVPYALLAVPLIGAYLYGRNEKRIAWIMIIAWAIVQIGLTTVTKTACFE